MDENYFLRRRFADGREETEFMPMEDAYHRMPQVMAEELIARHKCKAPNVVYLCRGVRIGGEETIMEECDLKAKED